MSRFARWSGLVRWRALVRWSLFAVCFLSAPTAHAHELRAASLALVEVEPGRFRVRWVAPASITAEILRKTPVYPAHCRDRGDLLDCGQRGLVGELDFPVLREGASSVAVRIVWHGGSEQNRLLTPAQPTLALDGALPGHTERLRILWAYARLGVEHILTGLDHVLFVVGLMLLVRFGKNLLVTITAFTLAHSITLASAVLGLLQLPNGPVEVAIALSILLVAVECGSPGAATLSRRFPWFVAFAFGLLHGFGFAGALSEIGLPQHQIAWALACFNVGVEVGQLALVLVAWLFTRLIHQRFWIDRHGAGVARAERFFVYAIGSLSAYWVIDRAVATFG